MISKDRFTTWDMNRENQQLLVGCFYTRMHITYNDKPKN